MRPSNPYAASRARRPLTDGKPAAHNSWTSDDIACRHHLRHMKQLSVGRIPDEDG